MRDRAILDASKRLFYERGFDGVGVDEIGAASGVSGPAIYRHFKNKDEILATLFDEAMDQLIMAAGNIKEDPLDDLRSIARAHAEFALNDRELLSIYAREDRSLDPAHRRRLGRRQRQFVERWRTSLARVNPALSETEVTSIAYALIGMLLSAAQWPREVLEASGLTDLLVGVIESAATGVRSSA